MGDRTEQDYLIRVQHNEIAHNGLVVTYPDMFSFISGLLDMLEKITGARYVDPDDVPDCDDCERIDPDDPPEPWYADYGF